MLAPDSLTVTEKMSLSLRSRRKSRTKASVSREAVPLPMAMARTLCLRDQRGEGVGGSGRRVLGGVEVEDVVGEELAGLVDDGDLAAGAQAGVDAEHRDGAGGRGEQKVVEIVAEDLDGVGIGALLELEADLALDGRS